eukprot:Sspe_Gene.675::Locus_232_Transcript_1_1_Confidence_1.000_Length_1705::g.675::m.675
MSRSLRGGRRSWCLRLCSTWTTRRRGRLLCKRTDMLKLQTKVVDTGSPDLSVPVGRETLGRIFNVMGDAIDQRGDVNAKTFLPIHAKAPTLAQQSGEDAVLTTGIKVIDLILPYCKGGKIGLFGGAGVGKTVIINGADQQRRQGARRVLRVCWCRGADP